MIRSLDVYDEYNMSKLLFTGWKTMDEFELWWYSHLIQALWRGYRVRKSLD